MVTALAGPGAEPATTRLRDAQVVPEAKTENKSDALFNELQKGIHGAPGWVSGPSLAA
jgi:hypothetical protein